jgi:hypothetical protein
LRDRAALGALLWPTGDADAPGYEEIEARAPSAYEHWVGSAGLSFRGRDDAERLGDLVKFRPQSVQRASLRPCGKAEGMSREECLS